MSDYANKDTFKTGLDLFTFGSVSALEESGLSGGVKDSFENVSGVAAAQKAANESKEAIAKQKKIEDKKLAEKDDEIARRRLRGGSRTSLIATTPRGVQGLGG